MADDAPDRLLQTAALLAARDGRVDAEELLVLRRIARRLRLNEAAVDAAVAAAVGGQTARVVLPRDPAARTALLRELCEVTAADGVLERAEHRFLEQVAARLEVPIGEVLESLAPMLRTAQAAARARANGKALMLLAIVAFLAFGARFTGWLASYDAGVMKREHFDSARAGEDRYTLVLHDGERVRVPKVVHHAASVNKQVVKRFGAVWWTIDGKRYYGPDTLFFAVIVLGFLLGCAVDRLLANENLAIVTFCVFGGAGVAGFVAIEVTQRPEVAAAFVILAFVVTGVLVRRAWPTRRRRSA